VLCELVELRRGYVSLGRELVAELVPLRCVDLAGDVAAAHAREVALRLAHVALCLLSELAHFGEALLHRRFEGRPCGVPI
jgi:hypothetical protein